MLWLSEAPPRLGEVLRMTNNEALSVTLRGRTIRFDENNLACLNDIWRAAGFTKNQRPSDWMRLPSTIRLIEAVLVRITGKSRNWEKSDFRSVSYTKRGSTGGTFADVRLALAYAEYLNPKLALEVREVFLRYKAADATLADDILERAGPAANEWAARRAMSRVVRNIYTETLVNHGVRLRRDFANCTNATYRGLFGKTARQLKVQEGITGNLRDHMDTSRLAYVMAAEALSSERIDEQKCEGPTECQIATSRSAYFIRSAIEADRKDRKEPRLPF